MDPTTNSRNSGNLGYLGPDGTKKASAKDSVLARAKNFENSNQPAILQGPKKEATGKLINAFSGKQGEDPSIPHRSIAGRVKTLTQPDKASAPTSQPSPSSSPMGSIGDRLKALQQSRSSSPSPRLPLDLPKMTPEERAARLASAQKALTARPPTKKTAEKTADSDTSQPAKLNKNFLATLEQRTQGDEGNSTESLPPQIPVDDVGPPPPPPPPGPPPTQPSPSPKVGKQIWKTVDAPKSETETTSRSPKQVEERPPSKYDLELAAAIAARQKKLGNL